jgi:hypothetical protein
MPMQFQMRAGLRRHHANSNFKDLVDLFCSAWLMAFASSSTSSTAIINMTTTTTEVDPWHVDSSSSLLDLAAVFDKESTSCGHTLPLKPLIDRIHETESSTHTSSSSTLHTCPFCGHSIAIVRDKAALDPASETVCVKYGKLIYELTVSTSTLPTLLFSKEERPSWWTIFNANEANSAQSTTAQARIAQVLGLQQNEMKVNENERSHVSLTRRAAHFTVAIFSNESINAT